MKRNLSIISILLFAVLLWTVSAQQDEHESDEASQIQRGEEVFMTMGCTACHGLNAVGTGIAPALAGHTPFAIRRQLRAPVGIMPVYSPEMIPAEDVEALVAFITNLEPVEMEGMEGMDMGGGHQHQHTGMAPGDISFAHHWLLYLAVLDENQEAALHQIEHIKAYIEGPHLTQMESLEALLNDGDFEAALPMAESMVADVNAFGEDSDFVYLQMIYRALLLEDSEASSHFLDEAFAHMVNHGEMGLLTDVQSTLETGDYEAAAALLEAEYGESLVFEAVDHEHGEATEAAHEHGEMATEEAHGGHEGH